MLEICFSCGKQIFKESKYCISSFPFVLKNTLGIFQAAFIRLAGLSPGPFWFLAGGLCRWRWTNCRKQEKILEENTPTVLTSWKTAAFVLSWRQYFVWTDFKQFNLFSCDSLDEE